MTINGLMEYEYLLKLIFSLLLGLFIGLDRQLKHKPLGVKTSMVISVASCLVTIVSIEAVEKFSLPGRTNMDPMRLAAQIVSGVGFIGAGVILKRGNDVIIGLTTAAMVWAASALGIAAGAGFYLEAFAAVLLIIAAVNLPPMLFNALGPDRLTERNFTIRIVLDRNEEMTTILEEIRKDDLKIRHVKIKDLNAENGQIQIQFEAIAPEHRRTTEIYYRISRMKHVVAVEIENKS
jgi:putative Mg2+ transporter-C (MgtC) family protein